MEVSRSSHKNCPANAPDWPRSNRPPRFACSQANQFEQQECEPDPFQYTDLVYSLSAFSNGLYGISTIKADDAFIPARDRSPISKPPRDAASKLTITELRAKLEEIRLEGVMPRTIRTGRLTTSDSKAA